MVLMLLTFYSDALLFMLAFIVFSFSFHYAKFVVHSTDECLHILINNMKRVGELTLYFVYY